MVIAALRQQAFGSAIDGACRKQEVVRLTGGHHNLLRMWADVQSRCAQLRHEEFTWLRGCVDLSAI